MEGKGYVVASLGTDSGYVPYTAYSAKKSYLDKHPEIIQSFTNALQKGMDFVQIHTPEEIASVIAPQFPETDLKTITAIVNRYYTQDTWKADLILEKESFELLQDILESADNLCVGEANLIVKNEGAKASECADIGEHGTHEISTAVQKVLMASGKGQCADETWQQDIDKAEGRQPEKLGRERQDPEAQQRQDGAYNDDIETDELVANLIGNDVLLIGILFFFLRFFFGFFVFLQ